MLEDLRIAQALIKEKKKRKPRQVNSNPVFEIELFPSITSVPEETNRMLITKTRANTK